MRKYLFILIALGLFLWADRASAAYTYYRSVTVTSTASVASGTNSNFPMLFNTTANWLKTTSTDPTNGRIQNVNGYDHSYSTSTACTSFLNYENERYTSSTGEMIDWVNIPTMATGTAIYICYDDAGISTAQTNASATWDGNYKLVQHYPDGTTLSALDSTSNANNGSVSSTVATSTQIDGGALLTSTASHLTVNDNASLRFSTGTLSIWLNATDTQGSIFSKDPFGTYEWALGKGGSAPNGTPCFFTGAWQCATNTVNDGAWHYVDVVFSNGSTTFYKDGVNNGGATQTAPPLGSEILLCIGARQNGACETAAGTTLQGKLDEARQSNVVRSPSWILTEYNNQNSPSTFYAIGNETSLATSTATTPPMIHSVIAFNW